MELELYGIGGEKIHVVISDGVHCSWVSNRIGAIGHYTEREIKNSFTERVHI